jgi:hypothetical protein
MAKFRKIHGALFLDWLKNAGIIPALTRKVTITSSYDSAVEIVVEMYGTDEMVKGPPPPELKEAKVSLGEVTISRYLETIKRLFEENAVLRAKLSKIEAGNEPSKEER